MESDQLNNRPVHGCARIHPAVYVAVLVWAIIATTVAFYKWSEATALKRDLDSAALRARLVDLDRRH